MVIRRRFVAAQLGNVPWCEAGLKGCSIRATDVHEVIARGRGGSFLPDERATKQGQKFKSLCRACHSWLTDHPDEAERLGFYKRRWTQ